MQSAPAGSDTRLRIVSAETAEQLDVIRALFREYQAHIAVDLCFQSFEEELAALPGKYAAPAGRLLLAYWGKEVAGCVALRSLGEGVCEMKRLFVRPQFHGKQIGWALAQRIVQEGKAGGYARMRLDTLPIMGKAQALYETLGFRDIAPYCANPVPGVRYMEKIL